VTTVTPIRSTRSRLRVDRTVDEIEVDVVANVYEALERNPARMLATWMDGHRASYNSPASSRWK